MLCVRMTGHGEYRDNVSRVSLEMGMGIGKGMFVCAESDNTSVYTNMHQIKN